MCLISRPTFSLQRTKSNSATWRDDLNDEEEHIDDGAADYHGGDVPRGVGEETDQPRLQAVPVLRLGLGQSHHQGHLYKEMK